MNFDSGRSIYEQIVEYIQNQVLTGTWKPDDRIPSVRELAVDLGVNPNTVQRSYSLLQDEGAIYNQRGVGYFVAPEAPERTRSVRREVFERRTLPQVFETMEIIGYTLPEVERSWQSWKEQRS